MAGDALWGTPEDLAAAAKAAGSSVSAIQGHVTNIENQVNALMASWRGQAPGAFIAQHENWRRDVDALMRELTRVGEATGVSGNAQQQADDTSVQAMNGPVAAGLRF
ncbi:WXG100 family type VII secretion target [Actinokineospora bangkokensis]|uniref:ESAT-6-like protein n=1 Tax=Actinokineospora bangkokensis TaxID=1193682 RepID=A0A1Q9LTD5_9PSEU|nr:WXG100 family type VII secretion target [Actinokineospora bangkokensis]OLR95296.1 hypothetical protein BJP25_07380 [Actinokineospora bangkokensis]